MAQSLAMPLATHQFSSFILLGHETFLARPGFHTQANTQRPAALRQAGRLSPTGEAKGGGKTWPASFLLITPLFRASRLPLWTDTHYASAQQDLRYLFAIGTGTIDQLCFRSVDGLAPTARLPILLLEKEIE